MTEVTTRRPGQRYGRADGQFRAFSTIVLLTLHRRGEIGDATGKAGQELMGKAQLYSAVTPAGMSNTLHRLRSEGIVITDTEHVRTYSIRLAHPLSQKTVDALKREEEWARAFIEKKPLPQLNCPPPVIEFAAEDEYVGPETDIEPETVELPSVESTTNGHAPVAGTPRNGFSVSVDTAVLMRIIAEQAETIKLLQAELGHPESNDRLSSEVAAFLTDMIS